VKALAALLVVVAGAVAAFAVYSFGSRTSRGRYQVDIFADTVHLYDLEAPDAEPMLPTYSVPATTTRP
jgi:hypothetical protein